jgi:conjugative relaxase-like TrwC/TraI family protein
LRPFGATPTFDRVQSTHKIAGADAQGFADYLTADAGRGDYYVPGEDDPAGEDRAAGVWHGSPSALASLGLSAERPVQRDQLLALMNGQAPNDGREIRAVGGNGTRVAGIDMTFSAPKSVSALWAASSGEDRELIEHAHREAVESAIGHVERNVELVRTREQGELKWQRANSLVAAQFMHTSSRLTRDQERGGVPDPQLHTHVVVLAAERGDGSFAAVDSREVFRSARMNGAWYRSQLAHNLKAQGLQIPGDLAERWSTRTVQIEQAAREFRDRYGRDPKGAELGSLTTGTRGTKTLMAQVNVDHAWKAVAGEYGLTRDQAHSLFAARGQTSERVQQTGVAPDLGRELVARVSANSSTVSERDLYAIAYERSAGACSPEQAQTLVRDLARSGELVELQGGVWTTRDLRERERQTIATVQQRSAERAAPVSERTVELARREAEREIGAPLTSEQREALQTITGESGVSVLVGQAGVGKGVVLGAASSAWQREGYIVIGTAVAGATAERLGAEAKTSRSMTTDALLSRAENGSVTLGKDTVVMMDEAAMADTNRLAKLVEQTAEREAKLVLAGDSAAVPDRCGRPV